ncbi:hypothetical protein HYH03_010145 [Edaphochlamys debaryana]|uniref:Uncharacterized protein n=1 Tax=Edaphochlamys debaryana TaxID=47281 RepID=A0A836BX18_9CHLO|nr:hypothetical protein HYH03_010145 [Edaphochlamys debaryana]|eukprot:KAG2491577.1 hypothetical protein HYH03_010145 [Edaphochlamys debaryana]
MSRLTSLEVVHFELPEVCIYGAGAKLSQMTSLCQLTLDVGEHETCFASSDVNVVLALRPRSLKRLVMREVFLADSVYQRHAVSCTFEGDKLLETVVEEAKDNARDCVLVQPHLEDFLHFAFHRVNGGQPQGRLDLRIKVHLGHPATRDLHRLTQALAAFEPVSLRKLVVDVNVNPAASPPLEDLLEVVRLFGLPEQLQWASRISGTVRLRPPFPAHEHPSTGQGSRPQGQWPPISPVASVPLQAIVDGALVRMVSASNGECTQVLVQGQLAQSLLSSRTRQGPQLSAWVEQLAKAVSRTAPKEAGPLRSRREGKHRICWYEALAASDAVILHCGSSDAAKRALGGGGSRGEDEEAGAAGAVGRRRGWDAQCGQGPERRHPRGPRQPRGGPRRVQRGPGGPESRATARSRRCTECGGGGAVAVAAGGVGGAEGAAAPAVPGCQHVAGPARRRARWRRGRHWSRAWARPGGGPPGPGEGPPPALERCRCEARHSPCSAAIRARSWTCPLALPYVGAVQGPAVRRSRTGPGLSTLGTEDRRRSPVGSGMERG